MARNSIFIILVVTAAAAATLSGCTFAGSAAQPTASAPSSPAPAPPPPTAPAPTVTPVPTAAPPDGTTTDTDATCGPIDPTAVGGPAIASLAPPSVDNAWAAGYTDYTGYDSCAPLSWAIVPAEGATASSPTAILLFHQGHYLGTATAHPYGFEPSVARATAETVVVTYRYPLGNDSNADPTGRAVAIFSWDAATGRVDMTGTVPPDGVS